MGNCIGHTHGTFVTAGTGKKKIMMETYPDAGQAVPCRTTTVHDALTRVVQIADTVHGELLDTQQAVDRCASGHALDDSEMQNLQKLDAATQTVEALATALRNLIACSTGEAATVNMSSLCSGIRLGSVVRILEGESPADTAVCSGEMDFF